MKKYIKTLFIALSITLVFVAPKISKADTYTEPQLTFNTTDINQVIAEINQSNYTTDATLVGSGLSFYASRSVTSDGNEGQYISYSGWVPGSELVMSNPVRNAQRQAVMRKYGSYDRQHSYYLHTVQHIAKVVKAQTQGYITIGATATCTGRR